ncbi:hypothetical protein HXX76_006852 [Chlamydomonas incerta]|uniref:BTB domain-containing protein n=1 Tax=Chlamydomonas incerta TaxID=51695 RepID=A0A835TCW8_CHLIN|nr:hypothetical protein HXX76_006852 [Chlamydomonas incerta]|eukprot:KAG2435650.1 hypothetical protein HXX76_006852 [Chlamydomonas incerta]
MWPREGSNCPLLEAPAPPPPGRRATGGSARRLAQQQQRAATSPAGTGNWTGSMAQVCSGDRLTELIPGEGQEPDWDFRSAAGAVQEPWLPGSGNRHCQWVRWYAEDDWGPQEVSFSVRSGGSCAATDVALDIEVRSMNATCTAPRFDTDTGAVVGCAGNDGTIFDQCLWRFIVPRPGGNGWSCANCVPAAPPAAPPSPVVPPAEDMPPPIVAVASPSPEPPMPPMHPVTPARLRPPPPTKPPPKRIVPQPGAIGSLHRGFPFCDCKRRGIRPSPFRLLHLNSSTVESAAGDTRGLHCFRLDVVACDPAAYCCPPDRMDLLKLEVSVDPKCRSATKSAVLGGEAVDWSFVAETWEGRDVGTWKLPQLGMSQQGLIKDFGGSVSLCITTAAPCTSLEDFCMGGFCRYATFNTPQDCCPTAHSTSSPPCDPDIFTNTSRADVELIFAGGKRFATHSSILAIGSELLAGLLTDCSLGSGEAGGEKTLAGPLQLRLDDDPEEWRSVLPLLYPRMDVPRLSWEEVRRVVGIAHKYDMKLVLGACERFLNGDGDKAAPAELSAHPADPNYVLTWLEISERLHFDPLYARCMGFIASRYVPRSRAKCDYCGSPAPRSSSSCGSGGAGDGVPNGGSGRDGCGCACASCGDFRASCRCGPELPSAPPPAAYPSDAAAANGSAYAVPAQAVRCGYSTAAAGGGPAAGPSVPVTEGHNNHAGAAAIGGGGRGYSRPPRSYAEIYASAQQQLAYHYNTAERTVGEAYRLLYRRDAARPPDATGAAVLRRQMQPPPSVGYAGRNNAASGSAQQPRHASPYPADRPSLVHSAAAYGSCGSAAGRGPSTGPCDLTVAAYERRQQAAISPPLPLRVLHLVKGDRERLLVQSGPTLVELIGL